MTFSPTKDPIFHIHFVCDSLKESLYEQQYTADQICSLFKTFNERMTTRLQNGEYPKQECIAGLEDLSRRLDSSSQSRLDQSQISQVKSDCKKTLDAIKHTSEVPLDPEKLPTYIKMIHYIGTYKAPTNGNKPWISKEVAREKLSRAVELFLALTLPDLDQRKQELNDGNLSLRQLHQRYNELIRNPVLAQLVDTLALPENREEKYRWLLEHCLSLDYFHKHFIDWLDLTPLFEEFDLSLPSFYLKKFILHKVADKNQRSNYLKAYTKRLSDLRNKLPQGLKEAGAVALFLKSLEELGKLPREAFSERQFVNLAQEMVSYFSSAKDNLDPNFTKEIFSKTFKLLSNQYIFWIPLHDILDQERYDYLSKNIQELELEAINLKKNNAKQEEIDKLEKTIKGNKEDYKAMYVEARLLGILFTTIMISPISNEEFNVASKTFADLVATSLSLDVIDMIGLKTVFKPILTFKKEEQVQRYRKLMTYTTFLITRNSEIFKHRTLPTIDTLRTIHKEVLNERFDVNSTYYQLDNKKETQQLNADIEVQLNPNTQTTPWQPAGYLKLTRPNGVTKVLYTYQNTSWKSSENITIESGPTHEKISSKKQETPPHARKGLSPHPR